MTTEEWINKNFGKVTLYTKYFASVVKDPQGNIYSYGSHYPLLFVVDGVTFRNVTGYSSTTGKHIGWSRDVPAIDVYVPRGMWLRDITIERIHTWLVIQIAKQQEKMDTKKRKDTQVYRWLQHQMSRLTDSKDALLESTV